ncbi:MAG: heme-copper oxidase subunit III [Bacteriovoracaceae bacterium]
MSKASAQDLKLIQSSVAMTVALISWAMLFATLFLGYFLVRFNSPTWPPVEIQGMPKLLPFMSTIVMLMSSVTYFVMEKKAFTNIKEAKLGWVLTVVLGISFLALQWTLWGALKEKGILVSNGMVPSMVYAFSWLHAAHIVLALCSLFWLGYYVFKNNAKLTQVKLINVGKFWHFLGIVWLLMYLMMFVL